MRSTALAIGERWRRGRRRWSGSHGLLCACQLIGHGLYLHAVSRADFVLRGCPDVRSGRDGEIGRGRNRGDDNHVLRGTTGAAYLTARIARDRPDIHERMKAGEFRSARAAAIEAGIIKPKPPRPSLPVDPHKAADVIAQRYDKKAIRMLIADLQAVVKST